jgi:hypothetical protein
LTKEEIDLVESLKLKKIYEKKDIEKILKRKEEEKIFNGK